MKADVAKIWIEALESDEYQQGRGYLKCDNKYCCLGVLCEKAVQNGVLLTVEEYNYSDLTATAYNGEESVLPHTVQEWAGLKSNFGDIDGLCDLVAKNDSGASFAEIAKLIRRNVKAL